MKRLLSILAALTCVTALWSYSYFYNYNYGLPIKWPAGTIAMRILVDNQSVLTDGKTRATTIQAAMTDAQRGWNHVLGNVQFTTQILPLGVGGTDHNLLNEIFFGGTVYDQAFDSNTLAVTTGWSNNNQRTEADIIFNSAINWQSYRGASQGTNFGGAYDIQRVAIHELGHVLGLNHPDANGQSVTAIMNSLVSDVDSLQADDIAGAQSLYGAPTATQSNNQFGSATSIVLNDNAAQINGANFTATKEFGEPNHAGNAGAHSVWWKWTAPSNGALRVNTMGSNFDTVMGVYTGATVSSLTSVAANDDAQSGYALTSEGSFSATSGTTYYFAVDGKNGDTGLITLNFTFFQPTAPGFYYQPDPVTLEAGQAGYFYVSFSGDPEPTLQWQRMPAGSSIWQNLSDNAVFSGCNTNFLSLAIATTAMNGDQFRCVATNLAGTATSTPALLTVHPAVAPQISGLPADLVVEYGEPLELYPNIQGTQPMTFQWKKDGVALLNGTFSGYRNDSTTAGDAGQYTLTATNLGGTVVSSVVTVTVKAPVPPVVTISQPTVAIDYGQMIHLTPSYTGTRPMTFVWKKDGVVLPNASYSWYENYYSTTANSGTYTVTVTNLAGTATSTNITVTVNAAIAPSISILPGSAIRDYGDSFYLNPSVTGTQPMTFQWKKDGVALTNATSSYFSNYSMTSADAGVYTLTASNLAGTVTSTTCTVTVNPPVAPAISNLSATAAVNYGESLNLYPSVSGTQPISYQWKKDGVAIAGAIYSSFSKSGVTTTDSGVYTLTATNQAGTATSGNCTVTVNAAVAPSISGLPATVTVGYGDYLSIFASVYGTQPITYQWSKDGVAIAGANYYAYLKGEMTPSDSGVYTLTATNLVGATSSNCSVTVHAAVAPVISQLPATVTINYGEYLSLYPSVDGTLPITYQWKKDGVAIAGADYYVYSKSGVTTTDSGQYTLTATNMVGTVTSSNCTVTVNAPVAPVISQFPATVTVNYGEFLGLWPTVDGTEPITFQWKKDGVAIVDATASYFSKSPATPADSGQYTVTASNLVGTVVSSTATVKINSVVVPAITQQPESVSVAKGYTANFSVSASGSPSLLFQWYKDGQAISGANYSDYSIYAVATADSGLYSVKVTNDGGSVTSATAELTVLPGEIPKITGWNGQVTISANNFYLSIYTNVTGTLPITYQWYKDGIAIPGATSSFYINFYATAASAGIYTLQATNEVGMATSPDAVVTWVNSNAVGPWLDSARQGDIIYFLATAPGRIMRYDLSSESWLPIVYLPEAKVPTAFLPTAEGVFIAYNRELVRRSLELLNETAVATSGSMIKMMFAYGSLLYFQDASTIVTYHRLSLGAGPTSSVPYPWLGYGGLTRSSRPAISQTGAVGFTTRPDVSPNDIIQFSFALDGTIPACTDSPYHGDFWIGSKQYLTPDALRLIDNSGVIYNATDMTYAASLGRAFDDLAFLSDGTPIALRRQTLVAHGGLGFADTGQFQLGSPGYALFAKDSSVFVFGAAASNAANPAVTKVPATSFVLPAVGVSGSAENKVLSVEDLFMDGNAVINLLSRSEQGIVRWDTKTKKFLPTYPLRGRPVYSSYAPNVGRFAMTYGDGAVTDIFPASDPIEQIFSYVPSQNTTSSLVALDDLTFLTLGSNGSLRVVLGASGECKSMSNWSYWGTGLAWQTTNRRLYSLPSFYGNSIEYISITSTGVLPTSGSSGSGNNISPPLRFSDDEALILTGNQRILNADLQEIGTLANSVVDGIWLPNSLYTIRLRPNGTELQQLARVTYARTGALTLPGIPLRIFKLDNSSVAVVTLVNGYLAFSVVASDLSLISYSVNAATILGAPAITTQPVSQSVAVGSAATFSAAASGTPMPTYQWQKNGINISGATSSTLAIAAVWPATLGDYSVIATNAAGVAVSAKAALTISTTETGVVPAGFDVTGYLARYPEIAAIFGNNQFAAWQYYRNYGIFHGEIFDELFRVEEYLALYPELAAIFGNDLGAALDHWLSTGRIEGKLGRIPLEFSAAGYFARNSDVAAAVNNNPLLAWGHYWLYGIYEGRAYDDELRVFEYLAINNDLTAAFVNDWRQAALHWMRYGRTEGRLGRIPLIFSSTEYLRRYPDVGATWGTYPTTVWLHFWLYGIDEGRTFDELFRVDEYLALNPDLAGVFGTNRRGAFTHWVRYGQAEGRQGRIP